MAVHGKIAPATDAERERLEMLVEECSEVIQVATKILRHGWENYHPDDANRVSNRSQLRREVTDAMAVWLAMCGEGEASDIFPSELEAAWRRKLRWAHHQRRDA